MDDQESMIYLFSLKIHNFYKIIDNISNRWYSNFKFSECHFFNGMWIKINKVNRSERLLYYI